MPMCFGAHNMHCPRTLIHIIIGGFGTPRIGYRRELQEPRISTVTLWVESLDPVQAGTLSLIPAPSKKGAFIGSGSPAVESLPSSHLGVQGIEAHGTEVERYRARSLDLRRVLHPIPSHSSAATQWFTLYEALLPYNALYAALFTVARDGPPPKQPVRWGGSQHSAARPLHSHVGLAG